jgi:hypothetical protein
MKYYAVTTIFSIKIEIVSTIHNILGLAVSVFLLYFTGLVAVFNSHCIVFAIYCFAAQDRHHSLVSLAIECQKIQIPKYKYINVQMPLKKCPDATM